MKEPPTLPPKAGTILGMVLGWAFIVGIFTVPFWELIYRRFTG